MSDIKKSYSKDINKALINFHERFIKLQSPDFPDEDYLEIDLYDYFERIHRQGWSCVKVKKIGKDK